MSREDPRVRRAAAPVSVFKLGIERTQLAQAVVRARAVAARSQHRAVAARSRQLGITSNTLVRSTPVRSTLVRSSLVRSTPVRSTLVRSLPSGRVSWEGSSRETLS